MNSQKEMSSEVFDPNIPDFELRLCLFGNSMVGKTSFLHRFAENRFEEHENNPTVGVDFKMKKIKVDDSIVRVFAWDTAG